MRKLSKDDNGDVLGIPLELLIVALVMAIVIPSIWGFTGMYIREQTETNVRNELEQLRYTIEKVSSSEVGNTRTIQLDFSGHPMARVDYVNIGGDTIYQCQYVRYSLRGRGEDMYHLGDFFVSNFSDDSPVPLDISGGEVSLFIKRSGRIHMDIEVIEVGIIGGVDEN